MDSFVITYKSASTVVDSVKISGAITYSYSLLYPMKLNDFINSDFSVSTLMPYNNEFLFPFPFLNIYINPDMKLTEKRNIMRNRKEKPSYVSFHDLQDIADNFISHDYKGIDSNAIKTENKKVNGINTKRFGITGTHILKDPAKDEERWIYNEVFTKEMFLYQKSYFIVQNPGNLTANAIFMLKDLGLSGRVTTGAGHIEITKLKFPYETGYKGKGLYILLSSFIPDNNFIQNIDFERSRYRMDIFQGINKDGRNMGPYRYFRPGSIFYLNGGINGLNDVDDDRALNFRPVILKVDK